MTWVERKDSSACITSEALDVQEPSGTHIQHSLTILGWLLPVAMRSSLTSFSDLTVEATIRLRSHNFKPPLPHGCRKPSKTSWNAVYCDGPAFLKLRKHHNHQLEQQACTHKSIEGMHDGVVPYGFDCNQFEMLRYQYCWDLQLSSCWSSVSWFLSFGMMWEPSCFSKKSDQKQTHAFVFSLSRSLSVVQKKFQLSNGEQMRSAHYPAENVQAP